MHYELFTSEPEKLAFKLLDGLIFGILVCLLIIWFIGISSRTSQNRSRICAEKIY